MSFFLASAATSQLSLSTLAAGNLSTIGQASTALAVTALPAIAQAQAPATPPIEQIFGDQANPGPDGVPVGDIPVVDLAHEPQTAAAILLARFVVPLTRFALAIPPIRWLTPKTWRQSAYEALSTDGAAHRTNYSLGKIAHSKPGSILAHLTNSAAVYVGLDTIIYNTDPLQLDLLRTAADSLHIAIMLGAVVSWTIRGIVWSRARRLIKAGVPVEQVHEMWRHALGPLRKWMPTPKQFQALSNTPEGTS